MQTLRDQDLRRVQEKLAKIRRRWDSMAARYPFEVEIPLSNADYIPPLFEHEFGMHRSAVFKDGIRTYGFGAKKDAEAFMRRFPKATGKFFMGSLS